MFPVACLHPCDWFLKIISSSNLNLRLYYLDRLFYVSSCGILFAYSAGGMLSAHALSLLMAIPPIILLLSLIWLPETPSFLISVGKIQVRREISHKMLIVFLIDYDRIPTSMSNINVYSVYTMFLCLSNVFL